jgi:hypothetical protein
LAQEKNLLNRTPVTQEIKAKIEKCDYIKLKTPAQET